MRRRARVRYGAARGRCPTPAGPGPSHRSSSLGWDWGRIGNDDIAFKTFVEPGTPNSAPADTTPPNACISSGPSGLVNDDTPTFGFSGSDDMTTWANLRYSYKVDAGEWSAFSSGSVTLGGDAGLPDGPHTLHVKVKDEAGNEDASPVERSFTVDATVPTVESVDPVSGARGVPRGTDVEVTFSEGMDPCSIDHPRFELYKWNKDRQRWQWVINTGLSTWLPDVGCDIPPPTTATLDPYPSDPSTLLVKDTKYRVVMAVQPPGEGGGGGAHVYDEGAGPGPLQQAALPGDHLLDLGRPGQHGDDNVALLGDLPGRVGDLGPGRGKVRAPDDTSGAAERLLRPLGPGRKPPAHAGPPGRSCAPRRGAGEGDPGGMHDIEDRPAMAGTRTTSMSMGYLAEGYLLSSSQRSKSETLTRRNLPAL